MIGCLRIVIAPLIVGVVGLIFVGFTHPGQTAVATLLFLPQAFPQTERTPLEILTDPPRRAAVRFGADPPIEADLYHPAEPGPHGAIIIYLGIQPIERHDPALVRLADGLARIGLVVLVPELPALYQGRLDPAESRLLIESIEYLRRDPAVDPNRIGLTGFSVGAGLMLLAAEDPRVADKIDWVNTFGGYFDAPELVREVLGQQILLPDGSRRPWVPAELSLSTLRRLLIGSLPAENDRVVLSRVFFNDNPISPAELAGLTDDGRTLYRLLTAQTPAEVDQLMRQLPAPVARAIESVSPDREIDRIQAHIFIMHDRDDHLIPYVQSRRLAGALPPDQVTYTEFSLFEHVEPTRDLDALGFAIEAGRLYGHLYRIFLRAL